MPSDRTATRVSMGMPAWALRWTGRFNVPVYRLTRGRLFGTVGGAPILLLETVGRKSGQRRTAPVVYLRDGERLVVIGSNAGNLRPPAWALNLKANPDAEVQVGGERLSVRARVAAGDERAELWRKANEMYSGFDDYEENTDREIAVFVLEPRVDGHES